MFELIGLMIAIGAAGFGYVRSRSFVTHRLRYVDAVRSPAAPLVAAAAAVTVAAPIVWVAPVLGAGTALLFGVAVGAGTRVGVNSIRRGDVVIV